MNQLPFYTPSAERCDRENVFKLGHPKRSNNVTFHKLYTIQLLFFPIFDILCMEFYNIDIYYNNLIFL